MFSHIAIPILATLLFPLTVISIGGPSEDSGWFGLALAVVVVLAPVYGVAVAVILIGQRAEAWFLRLVLLVLVVFAVLGGVAGLTGLFVCSDGSESCEASPAEIAGTIVAGFVSNAILLVTPLLLLPLAQGLDESVRSLMRRRNP